MRWLKRLPEWSRRFLFALAFYVSTWALVRWVTGIALLASIAGAISYILACAQWDQWQAQKAESNDGSAVES